MPVSCATTFSPLSFETIRTAPVASRAKADVLKLSIRCMNTDIGEGCEDADDDAADAPEPPLPGGRCCGWAAAPPPLLGRLCFLLVEPSPVSFRFGIEGGAN